MQGYFGCNDKKLVFHFAKYPLLDFNKLLWCFGFISEALSRLISHIYSKYQVLYIKHIVRPGDYGIIWSPLDRFQDFYWPNPLYLKTNTRATMLRNYSTLL